MKNSVSIEELRTNLADWIGRVMYGQDRIVIKKYNQEAAVLLSLEDYEKLVDPTKRLTSSQWNEQVQKLESIRSQMSPVEPTDIKKEINLAIKETRKK